MTELTPKQEAFCFAYIETGNASEAYRQAYETEDMKSETVHRKAKELMDNGKITARIEELKAEHAERHKLTVDDLLKELEEARILAREKENPNAMTQATMGKAKLLGLDKQVTDPCFDGETGKGDMILSVNCSSIKDGKALDETCILKAGTHEFITRDSFIFYRHIRIDSLDEIKANIEAGYFIQKALINDEAYQQILKGVLSSKSVTPRYKR
ncbi:TPA: terminase small subunit, partial [Mannheimia haemolytica]|nr:terminase small subunit [Mannheimia haemolytica]HDL6315450.1 terminase small subunit [Mannheimia haemolytica]